MEKITKYAKFVFDEVDKDLIGELEDYLNFHAEEIFQFFDPDLPRKIVKICIISTKSEYDEIVKKRRGVMDIPTWEIGNCQEETIEYVSLHDYKNTSHAFPPEEYAEALGEYKKTIVHEYTHFVEVLYTEKNNSDYPIKWLNEGIAQYLSNQRENIEPDFSFTLDNILNGKSCYIGWYLMTKYVVERYGKEYFLKLARNNKLALDETEKIYNEAKEYYDNLKND